MKYNVKVTVLDTKYYPELQASYCMDPQSGPCPCYNAGDEFLFRRDEENDDFWKMGLDTLTKTNGDANMIAGGPKKPFCSEAWDAISRYICRLTRGIDYERLDEGRKYHDHLLFRWNSASYF